VQDGRTLVGLPIRQRPAILPQPAFACVFASILRRRNAEADEQRRSISTLRCETGNDRGAGPILHASENRRDMKDLRRSFHDIA
jgi:hypothetical protein